MTDWPFDQAPNVAAITCASVVDGSPILLVIHYSEDHSSGFLDGGAFDVANGKVIRMGTAMKLDPTIAEVSDLPPGWVASRRAVGGAWTREPDPDV